MKLTTLFLVVLVIGIVVVALIIFSPWKKGGSPALGLNSPITTKEEAKPSETFIDYTDPSGFSFSYPDNLSISNAASEATDEMIDPNAYADLQIFSKDVSGSLNIKITDTKLKTLNEWLKANEIPDSNKGTEKKLGELKAIEVKTSDRLMLAALDQGVLFTIEMPLIEQDFWGKVYDKVLTDFAFASPEAAADAGVSNASSDEIIFEGEEVVE